jgi:membrane-bound inhibitor of C-type lysozyme
VLRVDTVRSSLKREHLTNKAFNVSQSNWVSITKDSQLVLFRNIIVSCSGYSMRNP